MHSLRVKRASCSRVEPDSEGVARKAKADVAKPVSSIWVEAHDYVKPERINIRSRVVSCIGIEIHASVEALWVFGKETSWG